MYYHPTGNVYVISKGINKFLYPKNLHHAMTIAYTEAGPKLTDTQYGLTGYIWKAFVRGNQIVLQRIDLSEEHIMVTKDNITQVDVTFDQTMRPFIVYVADNQAYYLHYNKTTFNYEEVTLPSNVTFPRCELDMRNPDEIPFSDIILGYINGNNLCYALQRERFTVEHVIATDSKKSMLWRIGRLVDGRFGYQWR